MHFKSNHWAIIIGASGGIGMATAEKLAQHGMNLCLVHRDRRGAMANIGLQFEKLRAQGIKTLSFNCDALSQDGRKEVLDSLTNEMGQNGKVRMVLHALALGNLKLLAPSLSPRFPEQVFAKLAESLNRTPEEIKDAFQGVLNTGEARLYPFLDPAYNQDAFLDQDDFKHTLHAMGVNIVEWVKDLFDRTLFAEDARVLTLTSEGNQVAWKGYAAVSAAKAVLESLSRSMAVEFGPYGIRSNVIQAGVTDTAALRMIPGNERIKAQALLRNPMGRLTLPGDVANAIYLLCTDEAAWINGALICVDGGERIA
ncbi:MAG: SDR family oxidoreductase [Proteobacteria bacterium]|nr:SDR family oxidoreductase [Pseudomonadota bacterium]